MAPNFHTVPAASSYKLILIVIRVLRERLLQRLLLQRRLPPAGRPRPPLYWNMGISDSAVSLMLTE